MVHSIELLFDERLDAAIRRDWAALADAGLPSQGRQHAATNRPHVTLAVSERIDADADALLGTLSARLPLACRVGAPMLFGSRVFTLVRLIVPSAELLALHAEVAAACRPHLQPGPYPHSVVGQWTPHVTLCRRLPPDQVSAALAAIGRADIVGSFGGLRHWDGDARQEHLIG